MTFYNYVPVTITSDSPTPLIPSLLNYKVLPVLPMTVSVNPVINYPLHPSLDLNRDSNLHDMMTKYFYYKTLDKWLKYEKDMLELLNYLKIKDNKVVLIDNLKDLKVELDNEQYVIDKKVDFIEHNILFKDDIYYILKKFVKETSTNWYDLEEKGTYFIKEIIKKFIKSKFKDAIELKSKKNN